MKTITKKTIEKLVKDKIWGACYVDQENNSLYLVDKNQRWVVRIKFHNIADYDISTFNNVISEYFTLENVKKIIEIPFSHMITVEDFFNYATQTVIAPYLFTLMNGKIIDGNNSDKEYLSFFPLDDLQVLNKYFGLGKDGLYSIYFDFGDSKAVRVSVVDTKHKQTEIESLDIVISAFLYPKDALLSVIPIPLYGDFDDPLPYTEDNTNKNNERKVN